MSIIPPRRGEPISLDGFPTVRFSEYLERAATAIEEAEAGGGDFTTITGSPFDNEELGQLLKDTQLLHYWML